MLDSIDKRYCCIYFILLFFFCTVIPFFFFYISPHFHSYLLFISCENKHYDQSSYIVYISVYSFWFRLFKVNQLTCEH
jgi:hypothetical protein